MSHALDVIHAGGPARDALFDYVNGRLKPEAADWVRSHLDSCSDCRQLVERLEAAREVLQPPEENPFLKQHRVATALRRLESGASERWGAWRLGVLGAGLATAAAVCALVVWRVAAGPATPLPAVASLPAPCAVWARSGSAQLGDEGRTELEAGMRVQPGEAVVVKPGARVSARWGEAKLLVEGTSKNGRVRLEASDPREHILRLEQARVTLDVDPLSGGKTLSVIAGGARVTVHGTRFYVEERDAQVVVAVDRGQVRVERDGRALELAAGERWSSSSGAAASLAAEDRQSLERFPRFEAPGEGEWGNLDVVANAPEAEVSIDGESYGPAPVSAQLAPGRHAVRVEASGRVAVQEQVEVAAGKSALLQAELAEPVDPGAPAASRTDPLAKARALVLARSYPAALAQLEAIHRRGGSPTLLSRARLLEASVFRLQERPQEAVSVLSAVAKGSGPEAQQAQVLIAQTLGNDLADARGAAEAWSAYRRRFPRGIFNQEAAFREGEALLAAGQSAQGVAALEQYLTEFPKGARVVDAHLLAAGARRDALADCAGAVVHFKAISGDRGPTALLALIGEARCLKSLGREPEARAAYTRYLAAAPRGRYAREARAQTSP